MNELKVKMIEKTIRKYKNMVGVNIGTAEVMNNLNAPKDAKIYIERAKTLQMVIEDLELML